MRKFAILLTSIVAVAAPLPAHAESIAEKLMAEAGVDQPASTSALATSLKVNLLQSEATPSPAADNPATQLDPQSGTQLQLALQLANGTASAQQRANYAAEYASVIAPLGSRVATPGSSGPGVAGLFDAPPVINLSVAPEGAVDAPAVPAPGNNVGMTAEQKAAGDVWGEPTVAGDVDLPVVAPNGNGADGIGMLPLGSAMTF
jgi:hypothetical protein